MVKNKMTQKQRERKAKNDIKKHLKSIKRKKIKSVKKQEAVKAKAAEEQKFREHMNRLLSSAR